MEPVREFNFEGVAAAEGYTMTQPGTIGLFLIEKIEFGESKTKKTPQMKLFFTCKMRVDEKGQLVDDNSTFNHPFYMGSDGALKRVQYLAKVIRGEEFTGRLTTAQLEATFLNKEIGLKVTGQVGDNGKGYPALSFAGFAKPAAEFKADCSILSFNSTEAAEIREALEAIASSRSTNADSEDSAGAAAPQSGSSKKPF